MSADDHKRELVKRLNKKVAALDRPALEFALSRLGRKFLGAGVLQEMRVVFDALASSTNLEFMSLPVCASRFYCADILISFAGSALRICAAWPSDVGSPRHRQDVPL
jgi:hypothetical protein